LQRFPREQPLEAGDELCQFRLGVGVVEAAHGGQVLDGRKRCGRLAADALAGRPWSDQRREGLLKVKEFPVEAVVFLIANDGLIADVIKVIVMAKRLA
jgi:hypothetical protein